MSHKTEERLSTFGNIFFVISVIIAIIIVICGFTFASAFSTVSGYYSNSIDVGSYVSVLSVFLLIAAYIVASGFLLKCLLEGFSQLIQNTRLTVETLSYQANNSKQTKIADDWQCKKCNKLNKNYVTTCACGQDKNKNN